MKKLYLFLFLGLFLFSLTSVSALEWDNVKNYDSINKEVIITNALGFGSDLAKLKLISPENKIVPAGKDVLVGEFIYIGTEDFRYAFNSGLELKDLKKDKKITRNAQYKYKKYKEVRVDDYETICEQLISKNGTLYQDCYKDEIGNHLETRFDWMPINNPNEIFIEGKEYEIGIFVDVEVGDYGDWIPKDVLGIDIPEWSTWTESLNVDLFSYYDLNSSDSNVVVDLVGNNNGTNAGADVVAGKIENGYDFENGDADFTKYPDTVGLDGVSAMSWNFWFKPETQTDGHVLIRKRIPASTTSYNMFLEGGTPVFKAAIETAGGTSFVTSNTTMTNGNWYMITVTISDGDVIIYLNGHPVGSNSDGSGSIVDGGATSLLSVGCNLQTTGSCFAGTGTDGIIDELGIWDRVLSPTEILEQLYNEGNGNTYTTDYNIAPNITLNSPLSDTNYTSPQTIIFNFSVFDDFNLTDVKLYVNGILNQTNATGVNNSDYLFSLDLGDGDYTINAVATDNASLSANSSSVRIYIDSIKPQLNVSSPTSSYDYGGIGFNETLNVTFTDANLESCWYNYNGTNITIDGCLTGIKNSTNFLLEANNFNMTIYANDTSGNENSTFVSWTYKVFENSRTYTESTFETQSETFSLNVKTPSTPTAIFVYNGTQYTVPVISSGDNYTISKTIDIPIGVGDNYFYFNITVGGSEIKLDNSTQQVNLTFFTPTNATYTTQFLNISFKDENSLTPINMTVPFSEFVYYLGSGSVNKTMNFANTTENYNYIFSGTTGALSLKVLPVVQYRKVDEYPQRIWEPEVRTYNNTLTNQVLYSLSSVSGIFVTYQVLTSGESPIENVDVTSTRQVSGTTVQVGAGLTDSSGLITFWMNPDFQHTITFSKEGFSDYLFTHFPTQTAYTITLGDQEEPDVDCGQGISQTVRPSQDFIYRNQVYDFNYTISTSYWNLTSFQITLTDSSGAVLGTSSSSVSSGGTLSVDDINVSNYTSIIMTYFYQVDHEDCSQVTNKRVWITQTTDGTEFSIFQLVQDSNTYISAGLFGFDNFGKTLLSLVVIVLMVGGLSKRYGIASEGAVMGLLFGVVFFLDVGLGFIPVVNIGDITSIEHFFTYIIFIILLGVIIREERR